jgi:hypothetical protein
MPTRLTIFAGRLFLDVGSIAVGVGIGAITWPFTSWKTGLAVGVAAHAAICVCTSFSGCFWEVEFSYGRAIARLKKSLAAGKTPDRPSRRSWWSSAVRART